MRKSKGEAWSGRSQCAPAHEPPPSAPDRPSRPWADITPVDEGMAMARHIGGEHADLAVRDLAGRACVHASAAPTPHDALPCFESPSHQEPSTASGSASVSSAYGRAQCHLRNASASHRPRPRIACWRCRGPDRPPLPLCIQPVLPRLSAKKPRPEKDPLTPATRSCVNKAASDPSHPRSMTMPKAHRRRLDPDAPVIHVVSESW